MIDPKIQQIIDDLPTDNWAIVEGSRRDHRMIRRRRENPSTPIWDCPLKVGCPGHSAIRSGSLLGLTPQQTHDVMEAADFTDGFFGDTDLTELREIRQALIKHCKPREIQS